MPPIAARCAGHFHPLGPSGDAQPQLAGSSRPRQKPHAYRRAHHRVDRVLMRTVDVIVKVVLTLIAIGLFALWARLVPPTGQNGASGPVRIRRMLENLGPTFTKLGQLIAGRQELVPASYRAELTHLRDQATPLPPEVALGILRRAYVEPLDEVFPTLAPEPIAAGSIGQVHRATISDGRTVAVKVRRPDAYALIEADLAVLEALARLVHRLIPWFRRHDLPALVDQFSTSLREELDYELEATHAAHIAASLNHLDWVSVPVVIEPLCRPDVLVMEFVEGVPLTDVDRLTRLGYDRELLGSEVIAVNLQLILFSDVFHSDPHAGNYLATSGGLVMLDFGQTGHSDATTRSELLLLLTSLVAGDAVQVADAVRSISGADASGALTLGEDVSTFVAALSDSPLGTLRIGAVLHDLIRIVHRHNLTMPPEMTMLIKAVFEVESTMEELHAELRLTDVVPLALGLGAGHHALAVQAA
jgi:ubiquinone biosynthesis protein